MKKTDLVKFSLTLVSAAVLAACSSGKSNKSQVPAQPENPVTEQPQTPPPAEEKQDNVVNKTKDTLTGKAFGHKAVEKNKSNLDLGSTEYVTSPVATSMVNPLHKSLDTIVVATSDFKNERKAAYLEDFDFRLTQAKMEQAHTDGKMVLEHIHITADGHTKASGRDRTDGVSATKTSKQGTEQGNVLVFHKDRKVYISTDETELNDELIAYHSTHQQEPRRDRTGTVAEVYGNRTFLVGDSSVRHTSPLESNGSVVVGTTKVVLDNLPYAQKDTEGFYTLPDTLKYVQYGRVTSKLNNLDFKDLREGIKIFGIGDVRIASYGRFGEEGTENHYFYRSNTDKPVKLTDEKVETLKELYKATGGVVIYNGHAVTYGLDHTPENENVLANAVGATRKLVSGTHVNAKINLADNTVSGHLYDLWSVDEAKAEPYPLVSFTGTLNPEYGSISGEANHKGSKGKLNATVFGSNIEELGGMVRSLKTGEVKEKGEGSWGAVFGAKAYPKYESPSSSLKDATDGKNTQAQ